MLARALVHAASILAPAAERDEFVREWHAELAWAHAGRLALLRRACGAFVHALWLRKEQWSLDMLWQDVRFAVRMLVGRPAFTVLAVLTLALGIGANAAIFSLVYGVLLKPLPFKQPDRLVQIWETNPLRNWTDATASPANLLDWKRRNTSFEDIAFYPGNDSREPMFSNGTLTGSDAGPERLQGVPVSTNFFRVLGVAPALGRDFEEGEQQQGRNRVLILSDALWRGRFGADPAIVGRDITLNARPYQVIGVMPPQVRFPSPAAQMWMPFVMTPEIEALRRPHYLRPIARLKDGVTIEQARGELVRIAAELEKEYPDTNTKMSVGLGPLRDFVTFGVRTPLLVFLGAVALVLLVACANLANLLLARASGRRREFAVRAALGGAGWRLARQLLVESSLLAACGGLAGLAVAHWAIGALVALSPGDVPRLDEVALDGRVLLFVALVSSLTAVLFGVAPAWQASRSDIAWLRDGTRTTSRGTFTRRALVVAQLAASVALVVCAGLLLRSFDRLLSTSPGFDPEHAISFRVNLPSAKYGDNDAKPVSFFEQYLERLRSLPGVTAAGGSSVIGLDGQGWTGDLFIEGRPDVWGRELRHKEVTPGYFAAMGLPLVRGRDLNAGDLPNGTPVVVVNEALARSYFQDEDPIGRRIFFGRNQPGRPAPPLWTIVGVVRDEKQNGLWEKVVPEVYETHAQSSRLGLTIVVRSGTPASALVPAVRHELAALDANVAMFDIRTLQDVVQASVSRQRFIAAIVTVFAALALIIAAVGVYGVVSYSVSGRTREIGVRMALGATRSNVTGLVLRETFALIALGMGAGLILCVFASRAIRSLLFEVAPNDPITYAVVLSVLAGVGLVASLLPVRRAVSVDPNVTLRYE
ncbi:MAG TPA: ABC transporter permease [Vicinamibacterales bacterium]